MQIEIQKTRESGSLLRLEEAGGLEELAAARGV